MSLVKSLFRLFLVGVVVDGVDCGVWGVGEKEVFGCFDGFLMML